MKGLADSCTLTLALTTPRPTNHVRLHRGHPLIWILLPVELLDLFRLEESHVTAAAALVALAAPPLVLADAAAAALLADAAHPPVLANAFAAPVLTGAAPPPVFADGAAAAVLALLALPPVLTNGTATALLAMAATPPVLTEAAAAALLAPAALPSVLAHAAAAALLAVAAMSPVLADGAAAAVLADATHPPVLAEATAAAVLAPASLPPVFARLLSHFHARPAGTAGPTFVQQGPTGRNARVQISQHSASTARKKRGASAFCQFSVIYPLRSFIVTLRSRHTPGAALRMFFRVTGLTSQVTLLCEPAGTILLHGLEVGLHLGPLVEPLDLRERQDLLLRAHLESEGVRRYEGKKVRK